MLDFYLRDSERVGIGLQHHERVFFGVLPKIALAFFIKVR